MGSSLFAGTEAFVAVAHTRSFVAAGRRLGVSTAAVSKAVAKLEAELGVRLLERTSRRCALTRDGALYLEGCERALRAMQEARDGAAIARTSARGELRVTVPFIVARRVTAAIPRLLERHDALSVRLVVTDRWLDPVDEIDLAVRIGELPDSRLVARRLRSSRWVTLASPEYLARRGTPRTPEDLAAHACLRFLAPGGRARAWTFADGAHAVDGRLVVDQGELLLEAAAAGAGICQVLDFMRDDRPGLVEVLADHAAPGPEIHAVATASRMRSANVRALLGALVPALA